MTDKNFKMTSLQVNPIYKPVFDKLDALAVKELTALDNSILWSRKFTKSDFKSSFAYPLIFFCITIYCLISYGVRYRLYHQYIKHGRRLEFVDKMDIDLDDVDSYPKAVMIMYENKKKHEADVKKKDDKIDKISDEFHVYLEKRAENMIE